MQLYTYIHRRALHYDHLFKKDVGRLFALQNRQYPTLYQLEKVVTNLSVVWDIWYQALTNCPADLAHCEKIAWQLKSRFHGGTTNVLFGSCQINSEAWTWLGTDYNASEIKPWRFDPYDMAHYPVVKCNIPQEILLSWMKITSLQRCSCSAQTSGNNLWG